MVNDNRVAMNETLIKTNEILEQMKNALEGGTANPIYGVRRSLSSASTAWVRTDDAKGLTAQATKDGSYVFNDFDNIYPWSDIITQNIEDNIITAQYGDDLFAFDGSMGDVMTFVPTHWVKRWQDEENEYIQIAKYKFDGAVKVDAYWVGRYTTSAGTKSISGALSTVSQNISTFRTQAMAKGSEWSQLDWHYFDLELLYLVEYADANSQAMLGNGISSDSAQHASGELNGLGMKSGCLVNDSKHSVIYRGVENPFGNIWQFVDGINIKDNKAYICYDHSRYQSDKFDGAYEPLSYTNANANGNPNRMGCDANHPLIGLCTTTGTSVYADYYYQNSGNRIALVGGSWYHGAYAGFFFWACLDDSSYANTSIGGRLLKRSV